VGQYRVAAFHLRVRRLTLLLPQQLHHPRQRLLPPQQRLLRRLLQLLRHLLHQPSQLHPRLPKRNEPLSL
jgi:hypothetical protein